ncbi:1517_t:CDS:2, partial [Funneliformis geosporum]
MSEPYYTGYKDNKSWSYRGFMNRNRDVIIQDYWERLDLTWSRRFLVDAKKLLDKDTFAKLKKKVEYERNGNGLLLYWKAVLFEYNKENQPASTVCIKRKITGERITPKKRRRKWMIDDAITRKERSMVYFVDPAERNVPLIELIRCGEFVTLQGPRSSGKSTRVFEIQNQLQNEDFICIYVCFEQINMESVGEFWQTFGAQLYLDVPEYELDNINSASDFGIAFQKIKWNYQIVFLIDEFDRMYRANDDVKFSCLKTLHDIKKTREKYAIWSVVATGPFSILLLNSNDLTMSPFDIDDFFQNPNFTLEQVQSLYKQFADEYKLIIDQET